MSLWLTPEELIELTGRTKRKLQREALVHMHIPFRLRHSDGFPLVLRSFFDKKDENRKRREPRLDLVQ